MRGCYCCLPSFHCSRKVSFHCLVTMVRRKTTEWIFPPENSHSPDFEIFFSLLYLYDAPTRGSWALCTQHKIYIIFLTLLQQEWAKEVKKKEKHHKYIIINKATLFFSSIACNFPPMQNNVGEIPIYKYYHMENIQMQFSCNFCINVDFGSDVRSYAEYILFENIYSRKN